MTSLDSGTCLNCKAWTGHGASKYCLDCKRKMKNSIATCSYMNCTEKYKPVAGSKYCLQHKGMRNKTE